MGRPIASKHFGNRNTDGVGGEGVVSVAVTGTFDGKTPGTYNIPASVISAPQITGGTKPTLTLTYLTADTATVAVVTAGTGYTSATTIVDGAAPTLQSLGGVGTGTIVLTAAMTTTTPDAITASAFLAAADGGASAVASDIVKQVGARRYKVQNAQGTGKVKLVTSVPAAGEMRITATDSAEGTYFVKKLESRTATLVPGTGTQFVTDQQVAWSLDSAVLNVSVVIANN